MPYTVELIVQFEILNQEQFLKAARNCADYVRANEPETLAYEWYVSDDGKQGRLFEQYASEAAFRQHLLGRVFTELGRELFPAIRWQSIESFGPLPTEFHDILGQLPSQNWGGAAVSIRDNER